MKWISVNDKLPEDTRAVLTFGSHPTPIVGFYNSLWEKWFCYLGTGIEMDDSFMDYVTHWQPLPKPPKE